MMEARIFAGIVGILKVVEVKLGCVEEYADEPDQKRLLMKRVW